MADTVLTINNINKSYGDNLILNGLSLDVHKGEVIVIIGPSGCGKTTVTRLLNGLAPHFFPGELEGEVWVDGLCVSQAPLSETSRLVGSVFQNPKSQFFNVDSTGELVFGCENQGMERNEMRRRLETALCTIDKGIVDVDAVCHSLNDEPAYHAQ